MAILRIGSSCFQLPVDHAVMIAEELVKGVCVSPDFVGNYTPLSHSTEISVTFTRTPELSSIEDGHDVS